MASCYVRGRFWWIRWADETGESHREPTKILVGKTRDEKRGSELRALKYACDLEEEARGVRLGVRKRKARPVLFEDLARQYLNVRGVRRASFGTIKGRVLGLIVPHFRGRLADEITGPDIDEFLSLRERGEPCVDCVAMACAAERKTCPCNRKCHHKKAPETLSKMRDHISAIFRYGADKRLLDETNPVRQSEPISVPKAPPKVVSQEVLRALLAAAPDIFCIFAVCIYTGLRKIEVLRIRVEDVDIARGHIVVRSPKVEDWGVKPIPPGLLPYLNYALNQAKDGWLFTDSNGEPRKPGWKIEHRIQTTLRAAGVVDGYQHSCRSRGRGQGCGYTERHQDQVLRDCPNCSRLMTAVGITPRVTFKDLRSTFGTLVFEETRDAKLVQQLLGHKDPRTTDRYIAVRNLVNQVSGLKLVAK